jgi:hypothetical protein
MKKIPLYLNYMAQIAELYFWIAVAPVLLLVAAAVWCRKTYSNYQDTKFS